ncbi:MAG: trypsin-like peptidase domain-containing protein [Nostoc sp. NMS1]|uniref:trypsin-like peptidase domain-containing protein n=1 Tax=unclassified Nostoc TaxID=2593658 RepID=UPI0025D14B48|nr:MULTISPECIES: trypsin-like peptidase domain-containing protein [unclassified Nostoc]MBN3908077.1 trypsin-like peptidase domain-containing protein [Nostoc sp. NMS1]MBN3990597.1 trypsin-like peptidase domain-containing protein [Nostoc sp. NMS2]
MTVQLSQPDFQRLIRIVQNLPDFANMRDRRRLVAGALQGVAQADIILARLDLDGAPMGVSVEVVRFLSQFGRVAYNQEALAVFLNYIQPYAGDEDKDFIVELFQNYPLDIPVSPSRGINNWKGMDSTADIKEKIIGENTLRDIYILNLALEASKAVVRIATPEGLGTGFMITSDLLMTNNHVIQSQKVAEKSNFSFNYQLDLNGKECPTQSVAALAGGAFYTNKELDYTVVTLKDVPDFGKPLTFKSKLMRRDDRVAIIQHPGGHLKKISIQNNFVAYADNQVLQYTTSTEPGSSGSPIFDDNFQVVGIHHSGGMLLEPNTQRRHLRNAGTSAIALLNDLHKNALETQTHLSR